MDSTNIIYPTTLPCPRMSTNNLKLGESFLSSSLNRRFVNNRARDINVTFVCESLNQLSSFETFYTSTLNYGQKLFSATWRFFGDNSLKEFRFTDGLTIDHLGNNRSLIKTKIQEVTK